MVTTRKVKNIGKTLDTMNNFQCSNLLQLNERVITRIYRAQEKFSRCDRITDKTLPILFPMENVYSEAALLCVIREAYVGLEPYIDLHARPT